MTAISQSLHLKQQQLPGRFLAATAADCVKFNIFYIYFIKLVLDYKGGKKQKVEKYHNHLIIFYLFI